MPERTGLERRREACEAHFAEAAARDALPIDLLRAVAHVESRFDVREMWKSRKNDAWSFCRGVSPPAGIRRQGKGAFKRLATTPPRVLAGAGR